jgi:hypothetical protein
MPNETKGDRNERERRLIEAKSAEVARIQRTKNRQLEASKKKFAQEGVTLRDEDIQVANISIRMPMSAFLFGRATLVIGGGLMPDPPRADTDPTDKVFADADQNPLPTESDMSDVG